MKKGIIAFGFVLLAGLPAAAVAQDQLPYDNGISTYHTSPRYRESESHPLRIVSYVLHPIGWVAREAIFRPISYLVSSSETTKSVFGFREPFDYRQPECFSADDSTPDCRAIMPYNYDDASRAEGATAALTGDDTHAATEVYFPDVNFDFDKRSLNNLGRGRARQIADSLKGSGAVKIVLEGHADYMGSDEYNMKLGMDRANAVRAALIEDGVDAARLATVSFGESRPLYPEQSDWARAMNRRVHVAMGDGAGEAPAAAAKTGEWKEAH